MAIRRALPYVLELTASAPSSPVFSATFPRGDGSLARLEAGGTALAGGGRVRATIDLANPTEVKVDVDADGDAHHPFDAAMPGQRACRLDLRLDDRAQCLSNRTREV